MGMLVTGFGPFGPFTENPSERLAKASGFPCQILEVSFRALEEFLVEAPPFHRLLMIGVAGGASKMRIELIGRNVIGPTPDVEGVRGPSTIDPRAPHQLGSTLRFQNLPNGVEFSHDAGTYLCNYGLFRALQSWPDREVAFLHIPPLEAMPFDQQLTLFNDLIAHNGALKS